jgi:hypothetical protein
LNPAAKLALEAMMANGTYQYQSDYARRLIAEGKAEGKAEGARILARSILRILEARKVTVSEPVRERILACTDLERLEGWHARALTATSAADVAE